MKRRHEVHKRQVVGAAVDLGRRLERSNRHPVQRKQHHRAPQNQRRITGDAQRTKTGRCHQRSLRDGATTKLKNEMLSTTLTTSSR